MTFLSYKSSESFARLPGGLMRLNLQCTSATMLNGHSKANVQC